MLDRIRKGFVFCYMAKNKRPTDVNQRAALIAKIATGEVKDPITEKDPVKAGLKSGLARAKSLTAKKRKEKAKKVAAARWKK
jgi:hypothetical protein